MGSDIATSSIYYGIRYLFFSVGGNGFESRRALFFFFLFSRITKIYFSNFFLLKFFLVIYFRKKTFFAGLDYAIPKKRTGPPDQGPAGRQCATSRICRVSKPFGLCFILGKYLVYPLRGLPYTTPLRSEKMCT